MEISLDRFFLFNSWHESTVNWTQSPVLIAPSPLYW